MKLQQSWVWRGGVTAAQPSGQTQDIDGKVVGAGINFHFVLPSKGGGNTDITLLIGLADLETLLRELANQHPSLVSVMRSAP